MDLTGSRALNTVADIAQFIGLGETKTRELLTNRVIPSVISGSTRKFYNTSTVIIDIAYVMICKINNIKFNSYKEAFVFKEMQNGLNVFRNKAEVISIINQKGGVGKTTTTSNLSAALSFVGKRVLLLDMDPQCNSTSYYAPNTDNIPEIVEFKNKLDKKGKITKADIKSISKYYKERSIRFLTKKLDDCETYNLTKDENESDKHLDSKFLDKLNFNYTKSSMNNLFKELLLNDGNLEAKQVRELIVDIKSDNFSLDLLPNELAMAKTIEHARMGNDSHLFLKTIVDLVKEDYDYIIIDTPPNAGLALENSLYASDRVMFASLTEEFSLEGMQYTLDEIEAIKKKTNKNIIIDGIFVNRYVAPRKNKVFKEDEVDYTDELTAFLLDEIRTKKYFEVPESKALGITQTNKIPVFQYQTKPKEGIEIATPFFEYIRTLVMGEVQYV